MVYENNFKPIIENKKPFETVYEIKKYEIKKSSLSPAARNKVKKMYGDSYQSSLIDKDISEVKGYGPCNWSNPRCSCQPGEKWANLRIPCLVEGCKNKKFVE
jgi:hypothetical protein